MEIKEFKIIFDEIAKINSFEKSFGGWFIENDESIIVLDLQKSNFGNHYELNIKIFIQGLFAKFYKKSKDLVKKEIGNIFLRQPIKYNSVLDFDANMDNNLRKQLLEQLFEKFINPISNKAKTRKGIKELAFDKQILLLPAVEKALNEL
jgi:hypothetical protein